MHVVLVSDALHAEGGVAQDPARHGLRVALHLRQPAAALQVRHVISCSSPCGCSSRNLLEKKQTKKMEPVGCQGVRTVSKPDQRVWKQIFAQRTLVTSILPPLILYVDSPGCSWGSDRKHGTYDGASWDCDGGLDLGACEICDIQKQLR